MLSNHEFVDDFCVVSFDQSRHESWTWISFEFPAYQPEGSIFFWDFSGIASPIVHINVFLSCWLNYLSFWFPKCWVNRLSSLLMTCVLNLFVLSTFLCLPSYFESKRFLKDIPAIFLSNDLSFVSHPYLILLLFESPASVLGARSNKYFHVLRSRKVIPMMFNYEFTSLACLDIKVISSCFLVFGFEWKVNFQVFLLTGEKIFYFRWSLRRILAFL